MTATSSTTTSSAPGMSLPRSAALTELLLDVSGSEISATELAEIRSDLVSELNALVDDAGDELHVRVGAYELVTSLRSHPGPSGRGQESFVFTASRCRRAVGVLAVERCARGHSQNPAVAVRDVLVSAVEDLKSAAESGGAPRPRWWAEWYGELGAAARAVVQAEATTWATQLWTALDWDRFERPPVVGGRDDWWQCPGRGRLALCGRADVRTWVEGHQSMLVTSTGFPLAAWRAVLAFPALVCGLVRGERAIPSRVVGFWPASGQVRVCTVDASALSAASAVVVTTVARITRG